MIRIVFTLKRASVVEMTKHCHCLVKISKKVVNFILRMNMNNQTAGQREMRLSSSALQRLFALIFYQTTEWITLCINLLNFYCNGFIKKIHITSKRKPPHQCKSGQKLMPECNCFKIKAHKKD